MGALQPCVFRDLPRKGAAGRRAPLRLRRSPLRGDSPAVLASRRRLRNSPCVRLAPAYGAQTILAVPRFARATFAPLRSSAPQRRCARRPATPLRTPPGSGVLGLQAESVAEAAGAPRGAEERRGRRVAHRRKARRRAQVSEPRA